MPFPPQIVCDLREVSFLCACNSKHTGKGMPFPYINSKLLAYGMTIL